MSTSLNEHIPGDRPWPRPPKLWPTIIFGVGWVAAVATVIATAP